MAPRVEASTAVDSPRSAPLLESALLITLACHAAAMLSMALLLLPLLPGGVTADDAARVALVAAHPVRFRLGWLPWHLTAASDVLLAAGLLRARWIPRGPAWLVLALTLLAVALDQGGQALWVTRGLYLAREAARTGDIAPYLAFEAPVMRVVGAWAALAYTAAAIGWSWCFARGGTWSPLLSRLSWFLWGGFLLVGAAPLVPVAMRPTAPLVAAGNAVGFVLLELWLVLVSEQVLRRSRASTGHGKWAPWRAPRGLAQTALTVLGNSRWMRFLGERLPVLELQSDITDVVYVNYLVLASRLEPIVPAGLELQRLGPEGRHALFTFLTYRHGHFGPTLLGLRRLFPSPVQSNWRIYVKDPRTGHAGVYFVSNAVTTVLHALGGRWLAEGVSMHLLAKGEVARAVDGSVRVTLDPGGGTAPDVRADLRAAKDRTARTLAPPWSDCFVSYDELLRYDVPQDRALATEPWRRCTSRQEIHLGIPLDSVVPLEGEVESSVAQALVGDAEPLSFYVPAVPFRLKGEEFDAW